MNPNHFRTSDDDLAALRRKLCGDTTVTLAVFQKDGESHVFENVDPETISSWKDGKERFIRFEAFSLRSVIIPDVAYWTEDKA